jgi:hypothetical protein
MPLAIFPLLLADIGEVIGAAVGLLFLVMWIVNQIRDAKKQMNAPRGQQPQRQVQQRPQPPAPAPAQAGQQADPLRDQVQEFLRRAQQQQRPAQPPAAQRPRKRPIANEIEVLVPNEPVTERRSLSEPFRPMGQPARTAESEPTQRLTPAPRGLSDAPLTSVSEHVADHIGAGPRAVAWQASKLGQRIIADDEQFDVQLKAKFDHSIGTLAASRVAEPAPSAAQASESPAAQIAAMLASPGGVRQAIVINEILNRPSDRW